MPSGERRPRPAAPRRGRSGYSLVVLIMAVTVLNIMIAAALPLWSERIKRDKEEELISRGFQYAEAIRIFNQRFSRFPVTFDELIKAKPRCIRQLWKDPMTGEGQFDPIYLGQGSVVNVPGMDPNQGLGPNALGTNTPAPTPSTAAAGGQGSGSSNQGQGSGSDSFDPDQVKLAAGPIVGVRSHSTQKSLLLFYGHDHYNQWDFRYDMINGRGNGAGNVAGVGIPGPGGGDGRFSTRWLGRPMPGFPPVSTTLQPGGGLLGGNGSTPGSTSSPFGGSGSSSSSSSSGSNSSTSNGKPSG